MLKRYRLLMPALLAVVGCANYTTDERYDRGLVLILPGIEGRGMINQGIVDGLGNAGVPYALEIYDWTTGIPMNFLAHEMDYNRNRQQGRLIAQRLVDYQRVYPGRPLWAIGQSGGGGVLVFALEALPDDVQVDGAVLLAPALSQQYNLAPAMRHCRRAIHHYYSPGDSVFLGMGTEVFGTIDRKHESAAGRVGFRRPPSLKEPEAQLYSSRLRQVDCSEPGRTPGHVGLHLTSSNPEFIEKVVAPLIWRGAASQPVATWPGAASQARPQETAPVPSRRAPGPRGQVRPGQTRPTPTSERWSAAAPVHTRPVPK